jgi:3-methyladenine DNA glycosylase AlkD
MEVIKLKRDLKRLSSNEKAKILQRFFKTGPGEYAAGDVFIGVTVPQIRAVVKKYQNISIHETVKLLKSKVHEERLAAVLILITKYAKADIDGKKIIYEIYLKNTKQINNWDLVDLTAAHIVGAYLLDKNKKTMYRLARSRSLWERRIAVLATFHYIKISQFAEIFKIAKILLRDQEDLIQKAVGWMLREVGKRNLIAEEHFLKTDYRRMPRTMLRYAIERFPESKRQAYLKGRI